MQLIDEESNNLGILTIADARDKASAAGLDLVELSDDSEIPTCKLLNYGRYKYKMKRKAAEARKKQKTSDVKEIKIRPNIDVNDYNIKVRKIISILNDGDKVKVTMRFRGREMMHSNLGKQILEKLCCDTEKDSKIESPPKLEGRQMIMVLASK